MSLILKSIGDCLLCTCFSVVQTDSYACSYVVLLTYGDNPCDILQKWIVNRGNWETKTEEKKGIKSDNAWSEIQIECKWSLENIVERGNVDTGTILGTQDKQPKQLAKVNLLPVKEESDKRMKMSQRK